MKKNKDLLERPRNSSIKANSYNRMKSMSYYHSEMDSNSNISNSRDIDNKKFNYGFLLQKSSVFIIIFIIFIVIIYGSTVSSDTKLEIANKQSAFSDNQKYISTVNEAIKKSFINKNKVTINTNSIEEELMKKYPEVDAAILRLPIFGRKPTLTVSLRKPVLILVNQSRSVALDSKGVSLSEVRDLSTNTKQGLPVIVDESNMEIELGKQILTSETINFIINVKAQIEAKNNKIMKIILSNNFNEIDIQLEGINYYIKLDSSGDPRLQVGGFYALKTELDSKGIKPSEYIDTRVEEKVFYK